MKILAALLCSTLVLGIVGFLLFGPWPHRAQERDDVYRRTSESAEGDAQKQRAGTPLPAPKESLPGRLAASLTGRAHRPNGTSLENMGISLFRVEEVDEITLEEAGGNGPSGLQRLFENHVELKRQARSNAKGEFSFSELEPGVYAAVASGPSFLSQVSDVLPLTMG